MTSAPSFHARERLLAPELNWLLSLSEEEFRQTFTVSPIRRTKWRGLIRNACVAAGNLAGKYAAFAPERLQLRARLSELAASTDPLIAEHATWAVARLTAAE